MSISNCAKCDAEFFYDDEAGVNVKFYEVESNARYFQASGVFPICPLCESKCRTEEAIQYKNSQITMTHRFMPISTKED